MASPTLRFKRGTQSAFAAVGLQTGEPAFITDESNFYIGVDGQTSTNKFFGSSRYWKKETASVGGGVNLFGSHAVGVAGTSITLAAPDSVGAAVTYTFPATPVNGGFLKTNSTGTLSWETNIIGGALSNTNLTGITTIGTNQSDSLDINSNTDISGITTFSNTQDSTTKDNGAVIIEGGVGIEKSLNVGGNLKVTGVSTFVGNVTFEGGTISLGDSNTDNIVFAADVNSNILPNTDATFDIGDASVSKRWRHASFSGVGTFATGAVADGVQIGINGANVIDTVSGNLTLNSAGGQTIVDDLLIVQNNLNVTGNVTIGGTSILLTGENVFIKNKDIVLGYTTSLSGADISTDITANHAGVAIASTEGTALVSFTASGINTLPDTYKQMMWFKSGTLGFSTDAFAFNYGVAVGTTTMANGVRFAVGSGITMTDTEISATTFRGSFVGSVTGNVSSADQVKTVTASDTNATYHITFVDANNGSATNESIFTDDGIFYNPGTNTFTTQHGTFTGNVNISGIVTATGAVNVNNTVRVGAGLSVAGISTFTSATTFNNGITVNNAEATFSSATVSDLTSGRVVLAGTSGSLVDDASLTYSDPTGLVVANSGINVTGVSTFSTDVRVSGDLTVAGNDIKDSGGTAAITFDGSGNTTITGNLNVNGSTTQVNTSSLTVEDRTIELGIVNGSAPSSATTWDLGILFNYHATSAKKSAVVWEHADGRFKFGSEVTDGGGTDNNSPQITLTTFAPIEISELWVNNACTGGADAVIACSGGELQLQNIVVDAGTF